MPYNEKLPEWMNPGQEPPSTRKSVGWSPQDRPPAEWMNYHQHRTYKALDELQKNAVHQELVGNVKQLGNNPQQLSKTLFDRGVNVKDYGCKGDGTTDDWVGLVAADTMARTLGKKLYFPTGVYGVSKTFKPYANKVYGEGMTLSRIKALNEMDLVIDRVNISRSSIHDIMIDGNSLAKICIDTTWNSFQGPSLNNSYQRVFCRGYKDYGWVADNNNDVYFERILIAEPADKSLSIGAFKGHGPAGPYQFHNCNFLDKVFVSGQIITFSYCVEQGIVINGPGFNVLKLEGGYHYPSKDAKCVIEVTENKELGPITLSGAHCEVNQESAYLVGGKGKLHYGIDAQGGHIFNNTPETGYGAILQDTLLSTYARCTSKFSNVWFQNINLDTVIADFIIGYENSYLNGVPYTSTATGNYYTGITKSTGRSLKVGMSKSTDGVEMTVGSINNIGSGYLTISETTLVGEGTYFLMLTSEHLDAPKAVYIICIVGNYGAVVTPLSNAPGIANYAGLKYNVRVQDRKIQVNADSGTGPITVIPNTRWSAILTKWKN